MLNIRGDLISIAKWILGIIFLAIALYWGGVVFRSKLGI